MRRAMLIATILAAAVRAAQAAPAPPAGAGPRLDLPIEGVITNPDWIAKPSREDVARFYPMLARTIGIAGRAELGCQVSVLGALGDCKIAVERPPGLGFAAAAMAMAPLFRMSPRTVDGAPVGGGHVEIPIRFLPEPTQVRSPPAPRYASPGPASLALARRLAVAIGGTDMGARQLVDAMKAYAASENPTSDAAEIETRGQLLTALDQAFAAASAKLADAYATAYAATFSQDELAQIVAFAESGSGQAWFLRGGDAQGALAVARQSLWNDIRADAVARFCRRAACVQAAPPAK